MIMLSSVSHYERCSKIFVAVGRGGRSWRLSSGERFQSRCLRALLRVHRIVRPATSSLWHEPSLAPCAPNNAPTEPSGCKRRVHVCEAIRLGRSSPASCLFCVNELTLVDTRYGNLANPSGGRNDPASRDHFCHRVFLDQDKQNTHRKAGG